MTSFFLSRDTEMIVVRVCVLVLGILTFPGSLAIASFGSNYFIFFLISLGLVQAFLLFFCSRLIVFLQLVCFLLPFLHLSYLLTLFGK